MRVDCLVLENFRCFRERTVIDIDEQLTALVGANGSGKTAAMLALLRVFGASDSLRRIRRQDFHISADESPDVPVTSRELAIEVHLSFPKLAESTQAENIQSRAPAFFNHVCIDDAGRMRCRIRLEATWVNNGMDGEIEPPRLDAITTFAVDFGDDNRVPVRALDRTYIQAVYVPAVRDPEAQVDGLLKGRLWRSIKWSQEIKNKITEAGTSLNTAFSEEKGVSELITAVETRWREVHAANTDANFGARPVDIRLEEFVRNVSFYFRPDELGGEREIEALSDGQRSLFQLSITAAVLDVESQLATDLKEIFATENVVLPGLTIIAVEEPENNLSPFYLSRIVAQLNDVSSRHTAQAIVSSHSASVMSRISPECVRYFRLDESRSSIVRNITLPPSIEEAAKYVREAVMRYPELYFANFVVLGEGSSEEIVLPRLGQALGFTLDRSFIAIVPLGGRHVKHLWKLLTDLDIPFATLLDLDLGRAEAGLGRIRHAIKELIANGVAERDLYGSELLAKDILDKSSPADETFEQVVSAWLLQLRKHGVFFCAPLDLDMSMLMAHKGVYSEMEEGMAGPRGTLEDAMTSVLGEGHAERGSHGNLDYRMYRYLFLGRGKPVTHARTLSKMSDETLAKYMPDELRQLVTYVRDEVARRGYRTVR